jgi:hypothetical protein
MNLKMPGLLAAALVTVAVPVAVAIAQSTGPGADRPRLSAEARERLLEGRFAMAKTALKLTSDQQKLWEPVEQHLRATAAEREQRRAERRELRDRLRQSGEARQRPSLADRIDRASERMAQRAERMKAFAAVFRPFYTSLSDEQKAVAGIVLRQFSGARMRGGGERWAYGRGGRFGNPDAPQGPQVAPKQ